MRQLFFVHIPKTAGTSFRNGAEHYFGSRKVACDYGSQSKKTSKLTKNLVYSETPDVWRFYQECQNSGIAMLSGHVQANKYVPAFGVSNTITFLREPIQRTISNYRHHLRNDNYDADFPSFYRRSDMRNRQSRVLKGVPLEAMGVVGITEEYADSIEIINRRNNTNIPIRSANQANEKPSQPIAVGRVDEDEVNYLNCWDVELYRRARWLLRTRLELLRKGQNFAHAKIHEVNKNGIAGWAWWSVETCEPVAVELLINDRSVKTAYATELRPDLCSIRPPRAGYVGFSFSFQAAPGDMAQCRIADTGQLFPETPLVLTTEHTRTPGNSQDSAVTGRNIGGRACRGFVDVVTTEHCAGWAVADDCNRTAPTRVGIYLDQYLVGTAKASYLRDDVREANLHPTGYCGFWFYWPDNMRPTASNQVEVWVEGDIAPLGGIKTLAP